MVAEDMQASGRGGGSSEPDNFMEIWAHNLEDGFQKIRTIVQTYPYIAMVSCILILYINGAFQLEFYYLPGY